MRRFTNEGCDFPGPIHAIAAVVGTVGYDGRRATDIKSTKLAAVQYLGIPWS